MKGVPFEVGKKYFVRTVTYHLVGKVLEIDGDFLILTDASWVADSGRFSKALELGGLREIEYVGEAIINMKAITDAFPWHHDCPKKPAPFDGVFTP